MIYTYMRERHGYVRMNPVREAADCLGVTATRIRQRQQDNRSVPGLLTVLTTLNGLCNTAQRAQ